MKKSMLIFFCLMLIAAPALAMTYANQPKDFAGLRWGLGVRELEKSGQQFVLADNNDKSIVSYRCATRSDNLYGINFDQISYSFFNGRFFLVQAVKSNDRDQQAVYDAVVKTHGIPTQQNDYFHKKTVSYMWQGDITFIVLSHNYMRKETTLSFYNLPLYQQWSAQNSAPGQVRKKN